MEYLKTYEAFQLGDDIWIIMDESEKYILGDVMYKNDITSYVLFPIENATMTTFKDYSYKSIEEALKKIDQLNNDSVKIGFGSPIYKKSHNDIGYITTDGSEYKRMFNLSEDEKLIPVKMFMGIMKGSDVDYHNL